MPRAGFEPTIRKIRQPKPHVLDHTETGTGCNSVLAVI
jgi:hypothetical protein